MIVVDASALDAYLGGSDPAAEIALTRVAHETWLCSPLALAEVLAHARGADQQARMQRTLAELGVIEVDLTSHAAEILGRLRGETGLDLAAVGTLQLALERGAGVVTLDPALRSVCATRGLDVLPADDEGEG